MDPGAHLELIAVERLDVVHRHLRPGVTHLALPARQPLGAAGRGLQGVHRGRGRGVQVGDVVTHHPGGQHLRAEAGHGVADHLDPALGQPVPVLVVEPRHDLVLDDVVERLGLQIVTMIGIVDALRGRDLPAELAARTTRPTSRRGSTGWRRRSAPPSSPRSRRPRTGGADCSSRRRSPGRAAWPWRCRSRAGRRSGTAVLGSSANSTICWISALPPSSAGCDLPAMTIWIGRLGSVSSRFSRAGSRSIKVNRLYEGTRRAKPNVTTSGSSTSATHSEPPSPGWHSSPRAGSGSW